MALHPFLESIAPGRILVFGIMTDATLNLPHAMRRTLEEFGISSMMFLGYRNYMAAVAVVGGATVAESFTPDDSSLKLGVFSTPVVMETVFRLLPEDSCTWMKANQKQRARLCAHSDGYGDLCDCSVHVPQILLPQPTPLPYDGLRGTVVLVIAGNRPSSLYSYFGQTAWLLDADPSLYCVSAWNDHGALHTSRDIRRLYRIETHPGYGWMMKRSYFEAVVQEWKNITHEHDWDIWMRKAHVRAERECIVPSVSRSFHYGIVGAHVNGVLTLAHFTGHLMSAARTHVHLNTEVLLQSNYERHIYELLLGPSTVYLNSTLSPCHPEMLPKNFTEGPLVVAFEMVSSDDHTAWARLGGVSQNVVLQAAVTHYSIVIVCLQKILNTL
ncbi:protein O-linked-mannose beta-1,2-N-acetylglucosaminyltransferase 1-like [Hyalella azteca]|uniref:Alpha-1,3-mannosyl-glycoprotein 2-beta-N-acetylglucosaminyltransferase n=1 Tax=Hyalella azteca TaxID=294128 RepID=A0A979FP34_HYAAZ|nr:protein O-linked-mannose beta-1,2-N-acetylglucosaminyltransferase 1-like [Hyalella azteca]